MDNVNHPDHYALHYPLEVKNMIEIILINAYGPYAYKAYCFGNELKYRLRAGFKGSVEEEIGKAMKYMEFREEAAEESRDDLVFDDPETINDGHGNYWGRWCPDCGAEMQPTPGEKLEKQINECQERYEQCPEYIKKDMRWMGKGLSDHSERTAAERMKEKQEQSLADLGWIDYDERDPHEKYPPDHPYWGPKESKRPSDMLL